MNLRDLKLPPGFNGIGAHYDPEPMKSDDEYLGDELFRARVRADFELMHQLGITCITVLNAPNYIYQLATEFGMVVLNRPFRRPYQPFTNDGNPVQTAHNNGHAALIQVNNEDELPAEWDGQGVNLQLAATNLINASIAVYDQGGIVVWQMLDFDYFHYCVWMARQMGAERIFERFVLSLHNYGINHPPTYREDDGGFLGFLWWAQVCQQELGYVPFMISGEWGWGLNESADNRYPPVTEELRTQYEMECYNAFRTGTLSDGTKIPDYYLAANKWIWHARGRTYWEDDAIIKADGSRRETFIAGLKSIPSFVRKFSWDTEPEPEEPEEETMPEFLEAFKRYAEENPSIDCGQPLGDQIDVYPEGKLSLQMTTTGLFLYQYGTALFFEAARPKA